MDPRVFLPSPAYRGGKRAAALWRPEASFDLALRVRDPAGAPIGEVFSFISGLSFRGKLAYVRAFASPPPGLPGALVITGGRGLMRPEEPIGLAEVRAFAEVSVDPGEGRYLEPLRADLEALAARLPPLCSVILLGSVATPKYVGPLRALLGDRLRIPAPFGGMGDMARGALMLRAAESGAELAYLPVPGVIRAPGTRRRA
jgi:hypothetical protein